MVVNEAEAFFIFAKKSRVCVFFFSEKKKKKKKKINFLNAST